MISHATNIVEHPELVAERIVRLAKIVGRENVMGGTDCGFAQSPFARRVHPTIMWAKLKSLAEGARIAKQALWGGLGGVIVGSRADARARVPACPGGLGPSSGGRRRQRLRDLRDYCCPSTHKRKIPLCEPGNAGSTFTPGPMVEEIATRLM